MTKKKVISLKKQITTVVAIVAFIASFTTGLDRIRGWFKKNEESKIHQKYINGRIIYNENNVKIPDDILKNLLIYAINTELDTLKKLKGGIDFQEDGNFDFKLMLKAQQKIVMCYDLIGCNDIDNNINRKTEIIDFTNDKTHNLKTLSNLRLKIENQCRAKKRNIIESTIEQTQDIRDIKPVSTSQSNLITGYTNLDILKKEAKNFEVKRIFINGRQKDIEGYMYPVREGDKVILEGTNYSTFIIINKTHIK